MIPLSSFIVLEVVGFFGLVMWFGWRQATLMKRSLAEDSRKAAGAGNSGAAAGERRGDQASILESPHTDSA